MSAADVQHLHIHAAPPQPALSSLRVSRAFLPEQHYVLDNTPLEVQSDSTLQTTVTYPTVPECWLDVTNLMARRPSLIGIEANDILHYQVGSILQSRNS